MTVTCVAYILLSLCCAAKSAEFAASTATCSSPDCVADDGAHALKLLQKTMEVASQRVRDASHIKDTVSKHEADISEQMKAKDEMMSFLNDSNAYWRGRALSDGSEAGHDLKLLNIEDALHMQEILSKDETDTIKQMKAKDERMKLLKTSVAYWRERALSGGSKVHALKLLQKTMEVDSQQVRDASHIKDTVSKHEADISEETKAKDEMMSFLNTSNAYWRDRALSDGSEAGHDLKLLNIEDALHMQEILSKGETDTIKQMKAKDERMKLMKTSVAYWRERALSAGSKVKQ